MKKRFKPSKEEIIQKMEEETALRIQQTKPILESDLFKFNRFIVEVEKGKDKVKLAPVHQEMGKFIDIRKGKKKLVLVPRGHLKSTIVTIGYSLQQVAKNPAIRILIVNATYNLACSFLKEIQRNLKFNEKFHMFWGNLSLGAENWSQNQVTLSTSATKEPTVTAMGLESNLTSQHYDLIILDDLVNKDYINTNEQIQKTIDFYKESLNLLEPGGEMIVIGTRWHDADLYGWILDPDNNVKEGFDVFLRVAYEGSLDEKDNFKALFPEKFSQRHLKRLYQQQGPAFFSAQYLNDPISSEDADFKKEWFKYYEPGDMKGRLLNKFVLIDPAISIEKDADYTGIVTIGLDEFGFIYILDVIRARMKPDRVIDEIFNIWRTYHPVDIGIEDVAFQKSLQYSLNEAMQRRGEYIPLKPLRPAGRNKDQRIRGLQPLYASGRILHGKNVRNMQYLEDELLRHPRGKHDDTIDALSYMLDLPVYPPKRRRDKSIGRNYLYA